MKSTENKSTNDQILRGDEGVAQTGRGEFNEDEEMVTAYPLTVPRVPMWKSILHAFAVFVAASFLLVVAIAWAHSSPHDGSPNDAMETVSRTEQTCRGTVPTMSRIREIVMSEAELSQPKSEGQCNQQAKDDAISTIALSIAAVAVLITPFLSRIP